MATRTSRGSVDVGNGQKLETSVLLLNAGGDDQVIFEWKSRIEVEVRRVRDGEVLWAGHKSLTDESIIEASMSSDDVRVAVDIEYSYDVNFGCTRYGSFHWSFDLATGK